MLNLAMFCQDSFPDTQLDDTQFPDAQLDTQAEFPDAKLDTLELMEGLEEEMEPMPDVDHSEVLEKARGWAVREGERHKGMDSLERCCQLSPESVCSDARFLGCVSPLLGVEGNVLRRSHI